MCHTSKIDRKNHIRSGSVMEGHKRINGATEKRPLYTPVFRITEE